MAEAQAGLRGIVFDLDGTLYDKRPLERFMARRFWYALPSLLRYRDVRKSLAGEEHGSYEALRRAALLRLARGPRAQERWRRWIEERYDPAVLVGMRRVSRAYAGARSLLVGLRDRGYRIGLVSDYVGVPERLASLELAPELFDYCLETERLGAMKPARGAAARLLEGMALPGAAMLMVGDRAFADQRFAEAAGMGFLGVHVGRGEPAPGEWLPWSGVAARLAALPPV
ncbi:MAG: HAD family hydrolase [Myxococcales bacterium]|nr:HAD family hydrolase [Myxococcales bacterium]